MTSPPHEGAIVFEEPIAYDDDPVRELEDIVAMPLPQQAPPAPPPSVSPPASPASGFEGLELFSSPITPPANDGEWTLSAATPAQSPPLPGATPAQSPQLSPANPAQSPPLSPANPAQSPISTANDEESPLPLYSPRLAALLNPIIPRTPARTWNERLDLLNYHRTCQVDVPGLVFPYAYTQCKLSTRIKEGDVFKYKKNVYCVKCGLRMGEINTGTCPGGQQCKGTRRVKTKEDDASDSDSSSQSNTRMRSEEWHQELFRKARKNPSTFPNIRFDIGSLKKAKHVYHNIPNLVTIGKRVYCELCGFRYTECRDKKKNCSRHQEGAAGPA